MVGFGVVAIQLFEIIYSVHRLGLLWQQYSYLRIYIYIIQWFGLVWQQYSSLRFDIQQVVFGIIATQAIQKILNTMVGFGVVVIQLFEILYSIHWLGLANNFIFPITKYSLFFKNILPIEDYIKEASCERLIKIVFKFYKFLTMFNNLFLVF